jgi:hypothetical protein
MRSLINISIDDVSPHPRSSIKVLDRCHELISEFPGIKFTLFIPISYWRTVSPGVSTKKPLQINLFKDFCDAIRDLPRDNFEIGYHGFHHGIPGKTDNDEFASLTKEEASAAFSAMFKVVEDAGLRDIFKPIFRPPAWRMSPATFDVCKGVGIKVLGLYDGQEEYLEVYGGKDKEFDKVIYANVMPPLHPLSLFEKTEIVYHACEWDKNYLDEQKTDDLKEFLKNNREKIDFCFMEKM